MSTEKEQTMNNVLALSFLRDDLLPLLLDEDEEAVLYWAGKELSRHYSIETREDVETFFSTRQLGVLPHEKAKSSQILLTLQGPEVEARFKAFAPNFSLEAGLLAGFYQKIHRFYSEASVNIPSDDKKVEFIIFYDKKEIIDN